MPGPRVGPKARPRTGSGPASTPSLTFAQRKKGVDGPPSRTMTGPPRDRTQVKTALLLRHHDARAGSARPEAEEMESDAFIVRLLGLQVGEQFRGIRQILLHVAERLDI